MRNFPHQLSVNIGDIKSANGKKHKKDRKNFPSFISRPRMLQCLYSHPKNVAKLYQKSKQVCVEFGEGATKNFGIN
jgi:hypothetical protein